MSDDIARTFGNYHRRERMRCEQTLADILEILIKKDTHEDSVVAVLERLERHWGREADEAATHG